MPIALSRSWPDSRYNELIHLPYKSNWNLIKAKLSSWLVGGEDFTRVTDNSFWCHARSMDSGRLAPIFLLSLSIDLLTPFRVRWRHSSGEWKASASRLLLGSPHIYEQHDACTRLYSLVKSTGSKWCFLSQGTNIDIKSWSIACIHN